MIAQLDLDTNKIVHQWDSVTSITQKTSYDADSIKKAIENREPYGKCLWLEYNNNQ